MADNGVVQEEDELLTTKFRKLYGRQDELATLQCLLLNNDEEDVDASYDENSLRVAFVEGDSGSGKSALIRQSIYNCNSDDDSSSLCVGWGKFEEVSGRNTNHQPFAALSSSLVGFANYLHSHPAQESRIRNALDEDDKNTLILFCRELRPVLTEVNEESDECSMTSAGTINELEGIETVTGFARLKNVLRLFFRSLIALASSSVVWILDDLQVMYFS